MLWDANHKEKHVECLTAEARPEERYTAAS